MRVTGGLPAFVGLELAKLLSDDVFRFLLPLTHCGLRCRQRFRLVSRQHTFAGNAADTLDFYFLRIYASVISLVSA